MCAFVLHLSCCPVIYFYLKAHSNLDALRASDTNPAKLLTVVKGFSKDLVSARTSQAIRWKKLSSVRTALAIRWRQNAIHPFEGLRTTQANPFEENFHSIEQLGLSVGKLSSVRGVRVIRSKKIVIRLNGSSYPAVQNNCQPRYCSKSLSPEPFATKVM